MKRIILLIILGLALFVVQGILNCSSPLETDNGSIPNPPRPVTDTIFITDTIIGNDTIIVTDTMFITDSTSTTDTLIIIDTLINWDTLIVKDTIINTDTIIIYDTIPGDTVYDTTIITVPDTTGGHPVCARLSSHLPEIVWIINTGAGEYIFEFLALADDFKPKRTLHLMINDKLYSWDPSTENELEIDQYIDGKTTIKIWPDQPSALGHAVDICLTIEKED